MSHISGLALLAAATLSSACVVTPLDYTEINGKSASVNVTGYGAYGNDTVTLQARNGATWTTLSSTTTAPSSSTAIGNSLYTYGFSSVTVPSWAWDAQCGYERAELRVVESGAALATFNAGGWECVQDAIAEGTAWSVAGEQCYTGRSFFVTVPANPC